jgi:hypothetical protein
LPIKKNELGEEVVVYNSNLMALNKQYEIVWGGEKWALKTTDKEVEV